MTEKYLLFSLDDDKSKKLGEVISNATCKKIANALAEKEASASDLSKELKLPLNTVEYNLEKLLEAGIIEKAKNFFWSVKGKKIDMYRVANKLIVISPKKSNVYSKLKGILPVLLISAFLTFFIFWHYNIANPPFIQDAGYKAALPLYSSGEMSNQISALPDSIKLISFENSWEWFLIGSLVTCIAFLIVNWKKL